MSPALLTGCVLLVLMLAVSAGNAQDSSLKPVFDPWPKVEQREEHVPAKNLWLKYTVRVSDGVKHGKWTSYREDGTRAVECWYYDGHKHGPYRMFHEDGSVYHEFEIVDGKKHGPETMWWDNGNKRFEGENLDGYKVGTWKEWYESGQLKSQEHYEEGVLAGPHGDAKYWWESGKPKAAGRYFGSLKDGKWICWHENGQKESEGEYQSSGRTPGEDKKVGEWKYWDEEGKLIRTEDHGKPDPNDK